MDIREVKKERADLEAAITRIIAQFEFRTGVEVTRIDLNRINMGTMEDPNKTLITSINMVVNF